MDELFHLEFLNIADDITIWGSTQQKHDMRFEQLIARLDEYGLTVGNDKYPFDQVELCFFFAFS